MSEGKISEAEIKRINKLIVETRGIIGEPEQVKKKIDEVLDLPIDGEKQIHNETDELAQKLGGN